MNINDARKDPDKYAGTLWKNKRAGCLALLVEQITDGSSTCAMLFIVPNKIPKDGGAWYSIPNVYSKPLSDSASREWVYLGDINDELRNLGDAFYDYEP